MRLAVIDKGKCKSNVCALECKKVCPVNKKGMECVTVEVGQKAKIDEKTCVGCGLCVKRCPFGAISVVNLPEICEDNLVHRFGENGFALYGLPIPRQGAVLGLLGRNGIGKSTAVEILAKKIKPNLGKEATEQDIKDFFQGNELWKYFDLIKGKEVAYKPQNLSFLSVNLPVIDLLKQRAEEGKILELAKKLGAEYLLENNLNKLSGGELQKIAIMATCLKEADVYFFDEPLAYLDIQERLKISEFIREISQGKTCIVVEHDLLILDYLTEYLNIFFGVQGTFGLVSGLKSSSNGVNAYLTGFLRDENLRIRDTELSFNFTKNTVIAGRKIADWPDFSLKFDSGFNLNVLSGEIKSNSVIGILGKNGTGKTSFVKCLAGLEDVFINGKKQRLKLKLDLSYKPQYLFVDDSLAEMTVHEIIVKEKINKKVASSFNLESISLKKIGNLSGGELQRFFIARCLSKEAEVYFFDEPSAYLDVEERITVAKVIKEFMIEKEKTAFVVDHDLLLVSYLADSAVVFSGESGKYGETSQVLSFRDGVSGLLKSLDITLRKDKDTGRPKINKKGSVLDRQQRAAGEWAVL